MPPPLPMLPADADPGDAIRALHEHGAAIVAELASPNTMDRLGNELTPWLETSQSGPDEFRGWHTRRVGACCARSETFRELTVHPVVLEATEHFLRPHSARIQLVHSQLIELGPGETAQPLHRDDEVWPWPRRPGEEWEVFGMWAVTDFDSENGGTRVVPGSHRWPRNRDAKEDDVVAAWMPKGSLLLVLGSVLHGGGENQSACARLAASMNYGLGWLRQVENQYLVAPPEIARSFSPALQDLLGYAVHGRIVGEYALEDPRVALLGRSPGEVANADRKAGAAAELSTLSGYRKR